MKKIVKVFFAVMISMIISLAFGVNSFAAGEFEESIKDFPESYKPYLRELHKSYPNWTFKPFKTGIDWSEAVKNEMYPTRLLVPSSSIASWKSMDSNDYNYSTGEWVVKSAPYWVQASESIVKYYMDPRNFLNKSSIFQFELLSFDSEGHKKSGVSSILKGTFMYNKVLEDKSGVDASDTYATTFMKIGRTLNVSPYHLASRVRQEQGAAGDSPLISGKYKGYEGYYNYYNINASGETYTDIITNGLKEAKSQGWNTRYKALYGGSKKIADAYINHGQNTLYLQKFDVDSSYDGLYWHQYMQNLLAADNEGKTVRSTYESMGTLNNSFTFRIPVYNNMPAKACSKPTATVAGTTVNSVSQSGTSGINIKWTKIVDSTGYAIYRSEKKGSGYKEIATVKGSTKVSYTDQQLTPGTTYYYKVKVYKTVNGKTSYSMASNIESMYVNPQPPVNITLTNKSTASMIVSWSSNGLANGFEIYRSSSKNGTYKLVKTVTNVNNLSFTDTGLVGGATYYYKVRAYITVDGKKIYSDYSEVVNKKSLPAAPVITNISSADYNSIKLVWEFDSSADGYKIYRSKSEVGKFTLIDTVTTNTYLDNTVEFSTRYYYKVKAYTVVSGAELLSEDSNVQSKATVLKKPVVKKLAKTGTRKLTLNWNAVNGAEGYVIYRKDGKNGKYVKVKKISKGSTTKFVNKNLKKGTTYFYKIEAYRKTGSGDIVYSAMSKEVKKKL